MKNKNDYSFSAKMFAFAAFGILLTLIYLIITPV